jgi:ribosomal protein L40E
VSDVLPWTFATLGVTALLMGLFALWQSLRAAFGVSQAQASAEMTESEERATLLDQKHAVLQSIKDLEFERDVGKISEKDFERLNRQLRRRAREVFKLLDEDVGPFRPDAEKMVRDHLASLGLGSPYRSAATSAAVPGEDAESERASDEPPKGDAPAAEAAPEPSASRLECVQCGTNNDADAAFCKKCGTRLPSEQGEGEGTS